MKKNILLKKYGKKAGLTAAVCLLGVTAVRSIKGENAPGCLSGTCNVCPLNCKRLKLADSIPAARWRNAEGKNNG
jgi:hypothetical protein